MNEKRQSTNANAKLNWQLELSGKNFRSAIMKMLHQAKQLQVFFKKQRNGKTSKKFCKFFYKNFSIKKSIFYKVKIIPTIVEVFLIINGC